MSSISRARIIYSLYYAFVECILPPLFFFFFIQSMYLMGYVVIIHSTSSSITVSYNAPHIWTVGMLKYPVLLLAIMHEQVSLPLILFSSKSTTFPIVKEHQDLRQFKLAYTCWVSLLHILSVFLLTKYRRTCSSSALKININFSFSIEN